MSDKNSGPTSEEIPRLSIFRWGLRGYLFINRTTFAGAHDLVPFLDRTLFKRASTPPRKSFMIGIKELSTRVEIYVSLEFVAVRGAMGQNKFCSIKREWIGLGARGQFSPNLRLLFFSLSTIRYSNYAYYIITHLPRESQKCSEGTIRFCSNATNVSY